MTIDGQLLMYIEKKHYVDKNVAKLGFLSP